MKLMHSQICLNHQRVVLIHTFVVLLLVLGGNPIVAQTTVQLPAIRQFSYSGGVMVPDGGSVYLGGNRSAAMSSSSRGLPGIGRLPGSNRSSRLSAAGASASVTIIDLDEMDRQILGYDPRDLRRGYGGGSRVGKAEGRLVHGVSGQPVSAEQRVAREIAEAKSLVRNARHSQQAGKPATAKHAYKLAIEILSRHEPANDLLVYARDEYNRAFPAVNAPSQVQPESGK